MSEHKLSSPPEKIQEKRREDILNRYADRGKKVCVHTSRISQNEEMEYQEFDSTNKLLESFLEEWNQENPDRRIDKEMIDKIWMHLKQAYVAGMEDYIGLINELLDKFTDKHGYIRSKIIIDETNKI